MERDPGAHPDGPRWRPGRDCAAGGVPRLRRSVLPHGPGYRRRWRPDLRPAMAAPRRRAREASLHALYEMDVGGHDPNATLERLIEEHRLSDELAAFARELLSGVLE